ncbi:hypothetical protein H8B09_20270 [Paenibacillus sp. PR3]|uniref:Secreted protein n=1 Tax=Paenibacillus terricola TaxID=2763503 RepID=A0ABR8MYT4_9BACL|nr:hypothetical protein [Paenibacillus terricola]MBD3921114.1 hypothetical protein [Paenibacillus terricola]
MKQTIKLLLVVMLASTLTACDRGDERAASTAASTADHTHAVEDMDSTDSQAGVEIGPPPLSASSDELGTGSAVHHQHDGLSDDSHASHDGMNMSASEENLSENVQAVLAPTAGELQAGQETELTIRILGENGKPIEKFALSHEKLLHLIIVSEDMQQFRHIHPGYDGDGVFRVMTQFAAGGRYKWFADFVPAGGSTITRAGWLTVNGKPIYDSPAPQPDASLVQKVDGIEFSLAISQAKVGENATLTYTFRDEKTGKELTDMENYLGAAGHVVILSKDMETYLHVHPKDSNSGSSSASFSTVFPANGIYKIWGQFQREGRVVTVPFVIQVG